MKTSNLLEKILSQLASKQLARLIPTVADSKKEERATSSLLASFMAVPNFAMSVLSDAGASIGKTSKITCYTEVEFNPPDKENKKKGARPDGLIIIETRSKVWTALIESKVKNEPLGHEQVEKYLSLAKQYGINAVVTISNQFATTPKHHPLTISKNKTKSVELYHFSWLSLKSKALLLTGAKEIEDREQAYILSELVRYLDHDSSGITALNSMPAQWKELCLSVQNGEPLNKDADNLISSVSGWHQLLRHLSLNLSIAIGQPVDISLSKKEQKDLDSNFKEDCADLAENFILKADFKIPNAASKLTLCADVKAKKIEISMKLKAPEDKSRATASINWLLKQLPTTTQEDHLKKGTTPEEQLKEAKTCEKLYIRAYWPKKISLSNQRLENVLEKPEILIPKDVKELPTEFEVVLIIDLGARFKGTENFVKDVTAEIHNFYQYAGQRLTRWVPKAPKIKETETEESSIPTIFSEARKIAKMSSDANISSKNET